MYNLDINFLKDRGTSKKVEKNNEKIEQSETQKIITLLKEDRSLTNEKLKEIFGFIHGNINDIVDLGIQKLMVGDLKLIDTNSTSKALKSDILDSYTSKKDFMWELLFFGIGDILGKKHTKQLFENEDFQKAFTLQNFNNYKSQIITSFQESIEDNSIPEFNLFPETASITLKEINQYILRPFIANNSGLSLPKSEALAKIKQVRESYGPTIDLDVVFLIKIENLSLTDKFNNKILSTIDYLNSTLNSLKSLQIVDRSLNDINELAVSKKYISLFRNLDNNELKEILEAPISDFSKDPIFSEILGKKFVSSFKPKKDVGEFKAKVDNFYRSNVHLLDNFEEENQKESLQQNLLTIQDTIDQSPEFKALKKPNAEFQGLDAQKSSVVGSNLIEIVNSIGEEKIKKEVERQKHIAEEEDANKKREEAKRIYQENLSKFEELKNNLPTFNKIDIELFAIFLEENNNFQNTLGVTTVNETSIKDLFRNLQPKFNDYRSLEHKVLSNTYYKGFVLLKYKKFLEDREELIKPINEKLSFTSKLFGSITLKEFLTLANKDSQQEKLFEILSERVIYRSPTEDEIKLAKIVKLVTSLPNIPTKEINAIQKFLEKINSLLEDIENFSNYYKAAINGFCTEIIEFKGSNNIKTALSQILNTPIKDFVFNYVYENRANVDNILNPSLVQRNATAILQEYLGANIYNFYNKSTTEDPNHKLAKIAQRRKFEMLFPDSKLASLLSDKTENPNKFFEIGKIVLKALNMTTVEKKALEKEPEIDTEEPLETYLDLSENEDKVPEILTLDVEPVYSVPNLPQSPPPPRLPQIPKRPISTVTKPTVIQTPVTTLQSAEPNISVTASNITNTSHTGENNEGQQVISAESINLNQEEKIEILNPDDITHYKVGTLITDQLLNNSNRDVVNFYNKYGYYSLGYYDSKSPAGPQANEILSIAEEFSNSLSGAWLTPKTDAEYLLAGNIVQHKGKYFALIKAASHCVDEGGRPLVFYRIYMAPAAVNIDSAKNKLLALTRFYEDNNLGRPSPLDNDPLANKAKTASTNSNTYTALAIAKKSLNSGNFGFIWNCYDSENVARFEKTDLTNPPITGNKDLSNSRGFNQVNTSTENTISTNKTIQQPQIIDSNTPPEFKWSVTTLQENPSIPLRGSSIKENSQNKKFILIDKTINNKEYSGDIKELFEPKELKFEATIAFYKKPAKGLLGLGKVKQEENEHLVQTIKRVFATLEIITTESGEANLKSLFEGRGHSIIPSTINLNSTNPIKLVFKIDDANIFEYIATSKKERSSYKLTFEFQKGTSPILEEERTISTKAIENRKLCTTYVERVKNLNITQGQFVKFNDFVESVVSERLLVNNLASADNPKIKDNKVEGFYDMLYENFIMRLYYRRDNSINRAKERIISNWYLVYSLKGRVRDLFVENLKLNPIEGHQPGVMKDCFKALISNIKKEGLENELKNQVMNILTNGPFEVN